jgi:hypothetical protein
MVQYEGRESEVTKMIEQSLAKERGQQPQQATLQRPQSAQNWNCAACTLQNPMLLRMCRACSQARQVVLKHVAHFFRVWSHPLSL